MLTAALCLQADEAFGVDRQLVTEARSLIAWLADTYGTGFGMADLAMPPLNVSVDEILKALALHA